MTTTDDRAVRPMTQRLPDRPLTRGDAEDILAACGYGDAIADYALRAAVRDSWFRMAGHLVEHSRAEPGRDDTGDRFRVRAAAGPDVLRAMVTADDAPALQAGGLAMARRLYGGEAALRVEGIGTIIDRTVREDGTVRYRFSAEVTVRCLDFDWGRL